MEVTFRTRALQRQYEQSREASRAYGNQVGRKYIQRINIIKSSRDIDELTRLPSLRCHPLRGDRTGQWAIDLTGYHRLIFTLQGNHLEVARVEEVSKHYED